MSFTLVTTCQSAYEYDIHELQDNSEDINLQDLLIFAKNQGFKESLLEDLNINEFAKKIDKDPDSAFIEDPAIDAAVSLYQGIPCFYVRHSGIEHIYLHSSLSSKVIDHDESEKRIDLIDDLEGLLADQLDWLEAKTPLEHKKALINFFSDNKALLIENNIPLQSLVGHKERKYAQELDMKRFQSEFKTVRTLMKKYSTDSELSI